MFGSHTALPSGSAPNCSAHLHPLYSNSCHPERSEGSAFASSLFFPFNFKLLARSVVEGSTLNPLSFLDALDAASSLSPLSAALTKNTGGWGIPFSSANSVPSGLKSTRALPSTDPLDALRYPLAAIPFRIRTSPKRARNPFRIRTSETKDLKPFRMCTSKKTGRGGPPTHYSLPTTHCSPVVSSPSHP
jgi:hypothetical protein